MDLDSFPPLLLSFLSLSFSCLRASCYHLSWRTDRQFCLPFTGCLLNFCSDCCCLHCTAKSSLLCTQQLPSIEGIAQQQRGAPVAQCVDQSFGRVPFKTVSFPPNFHCTFHSATDDSFIDPGTTALLQSAIKSLQQLPIRAPSCNFMLYECQGP